MHYRIAADTLSASLSDGAVLLHLHTKRYFSLNDAGARIWALLEQQCSEEQIANTLVGEYEVDPSEAKKTVHQLLEELLAERLIETCSH
ncbi:MAG TPA: PqqD family protein [Gemmatimonadaceae bacterium]|nr:PqqD family protein [Gemmatimonadaceae bacterium]